MSQGRFLNSLTLTARTLLAAIVLVTMPTRSALALSGGNVEIDPDFRGVFQLLVSTGGPVSTCSGVAVRPRIIMTAAHCVLLGIDNQGAKTASKVEVQEGNGLPVIAKATSVHVSPLFESLVRQRGGYSHVKLRNFVTYSNDLAGLSDHAFILLDRPVRHAPSLLDLVDGKGMDERGGKEGAVAAADVRAYAKLLMDKFYGGNDVDPVFVGFGNTRCGGEGGRDCTGYGTRRSAHVKVTFGEGCKSQMYTLSYFCIRTDVTLPGDSGGGLFLKAKDGKRYAVGILSGAQGEGFVPSMMMAARLFSRLEKQGGR